MGIKEGISRKFFMHNACVLMHCPKLHIFALARLLQSPCKVCKKISGLMVLTAKQARRQNNIGEDERKGQI